MAAKSKVFHDSIAQFPREWMDAVGVPSHRVQAHLSVIAPTKAAAGIALVERGMHERSAAETVRALRVMPPGPYFQPFQQLVDAGIIDPAVPAVYVWWRGVQNDPIVRVEPDGTLTTIGRMALPGGFGSQLVALPEPNTKEA